MSHAAASPPVSALSRITQSEWFETSKTVFIAVLLAMVFRSLFFEPFHIPSGSMKGNLLIGDYLFVSKYSYGYSRYSFPFGIHFFDGRILEGSHHPQRGDVVVFRKPTEPRIDFIKRVIGLPGDTIQVKDGVVYLNDAPLPRKQVEDFTEFDEETQTQIVMPQYEETLPSGKTYRVLDQTQFGMVDNTAVYTVPAHHYFMMGDNRDNSTDSRYLHEVGYVPEENLVGKAEVIAFSLSGTANRWLRWIP
jgi:signal peptidase I